MTEEKWSNIESGIEVYIMKCRLFSILICLCMFGVFSIGSKISNATEDQGLTLTYNNVTKVDVNSGGPMLIESQKYDYTTSSKNEIAYILNYINNFNLEDDGKNFFCK